MKEKKDLFVTTFVICISILGSVASITNFIPIDISKYSLVTFSIRPH